jgi:hypothetical protein
MKKAVLCAVLAFFIILLAPSVYVVTVVRSGATVFPKSNPTDACGFKAYHQHDSNLNQPGYHKRTARNLAGRFWQSEKAKELCPTTNKAADKACKEKAAYLLNAIPPQLRDTLRTATTWACETIDPYFSNHHQEPPKTYREAQSVFREWFLTQELPTWLPTFLSPDFKASFINLFTPVIYAAENQDETAEPHDDQQSPVLSMEFLCVFLWGLLERKTRRRQVADLRKELSQMEETAEKFFNDTMFLIEDIKAFKKASYGWLLELDPELVLSVQDVKKAYRKRYRDLHPDNAARRRAQTSETPAETARREDASKHLNDARDFLIGLITGSGGEQSTATPVAELQ